MSRATPTRPDPTHPVTARETLARTAARVTSTVAAPVRTAGFWAAIALPAVYLPLLYDGLSGDAALLAGLVALHVVSLLAGHGHGRDGAQN